MAALRSPLPRRGVHGLGQRLTGSDAEPANDFYSEWISLHMELVLGPFVQYVCAVVDEIPASVVMGISVVGERTLRYEIKFWDMVYSGESW